MSKFGAIPTEVICRFSELTKTEIIVLSCLYSARNSQTGLCNPRQKTIAIMTGINKTHVASAIRTLKNKGWISVDAEGQFLLLMPPFLVTKSVTKSDRIGNSKVTKSVTKVTNPVTKSDEIGHSTLYSSLNKEETTKEQGAAEEFNLGIDLDSEKSKSLFSAYREFFPDDHLALQSQETIADRISDLARWRTALRFWSGNNYRAQSILKICDYYDDLKNNGNGNKKTNTGQQRSGNDSESTSDYLASIGARPLG